MSAERAWACRYEIEWGQDGLLLSRRDLVVVQARNEREAQEKSGLVFEPFHEATDDELREWEAITGEPLSERELEQVEALIARTSRHVGRRREKNRQRGRTEGLRPARDADRRWAGGLAVTLAKLEGMRNRQEAKAA